MDYQEAGVDIVAGRLFVDRIRASVESTYRDGVLGGLGGFGGCFQLPVGYREPVLVSGTDGVGTKLKIAHALNRHDTIGIDLVAMCINDVLTLGAEPLFFLDYLATSKLEPEQLAEVVAGIAEGCRQSGCALLGGETAEMPGFYGNGEYDLAGFCVGIVEKGEILDGSRVEAGDIAIGLASSGLHSNGFSLARKIVETSGLGWEATPEELGGKSLGEVLLAPTYLYVRPILEAMRAGLEIRAMAHITGGGLPENLPRCLGEGKSVQLYAGSWEIPGIFRWLARAGEVKEADLLETFNLGIGFVVMVPRDRAEDTLAWFRDRGIASFAIGEAIPGNGELQTIPNPTII